MSYSTVSACTSHVSMFCFLSAELSQTSFWAASHPTRQIFHDRKCPLRPLRCCGSQKDAANRQNSPLYATDIMLVMLTCEHASSCPIFSNFLVVSRRNWFAFSLIKSRLSLFVVFRCFHLVSGQPEQLISLMRRVVNEEMKQNQEKIKCSSNTFCILY